MSEPTERDREWATAFVATMANPSARYAKAGINVLAEGIAAAREEAWKAAVQRCIAEVRDIWGADLVTTQAALENIDFPPNFHPSTPEHEER